MSDFRREIREGFDQYLKGWDKAFPKGEVLRIDLHCHDHNSKEPDELWGRILRLPETWLKTEELKRCIDGHGMDVMTVTNHNNAASCWELRRAGFDVLVGAEFTCTFPEHEIKVHVLAYGFSEEDEKELARLRKDIYGFLRYARSHDIPTVLAHPFFFYNGDIDESLVMLEKCLLLFERFEVLNGQRDVWQNLLTVEWLDSCTPLMIDELAHRHGINPFEYCYDPYVKAFFGGSDDHLGTFAGTCGTFLHIPCLEKRVGSSPMSNLALEAIRDKRSAPFGYTVGEEKISLSILDYIAQAAAHLRDPGLLRLLLHRGTAMDKLFCFGIGNVLMELQRHKFTMKFFQTFHNAIFGKRPGFVLKYGISRDYKNSIMRMDRLAVGKQTGPAIFLNEINETIPEIFRSVITLLVNRIEDKIGKETYLDRINEETFADLINKLELPSHIRMHFMENGYSNYNNMSHVNVSKFLDDLTFPALASLVIVGASLGSTYAINRNRQVLTRMSEAIERYRHPKRILWLSDTFYDKNGISSALQNTLREVQANGYPIDFLICSKDRESQPNLHVVRPLTSVSLPGISSQIINIPDILEIHRIFREGGYDRIVCSTEFVMGLVGLLLKEAFCVPAYFYMHTDWLDFIRHMTELDSHSIDRIRRLLRAFYRSHDGIFVLNAEHKKWLSSSYMEVEEDKIYLTSHWVDSGYVTNNIDIWREPSDKAKKMLFVGRLSLEKGVLDLPYVYERVRSIYPEVKMVFAGVGPAEEELRRLMPDALFLGWVSHEMMPSIYEGADVLLLPSRFDTFGNVVLEAMSCGLPVIAYDSKGPKDIIEHGLSGFLSRDKDDMAADVITLFSERETYIAMRGCALSRSRDFSADAIMRQFLRDVGIDAYSSDSIMQHFETVEV